MKKDISTIIIAISLTGGIGLTACLSVGSQDSEQVMQERPAVSSVTMTPAVPTHVTFCGEKIDLTRYNMYESMDRELSSFTYFHSTTMLMIKRANRYFPVIEPILRANDIPDDFKYLAVIESHLDPRIVSPARAAGIWQFMEATAKQYQLIVTPTVDERYHVERATEAACRYLREAYVKYGDWVSVAASYNAGMGRISTEYARQNEASALNLWLVEETSRYVYRIFAIKQIFENPYKYGFVLHTKDLYRPISCEKVSVSNDIPDLVAFAKSHNITYADLKRFNSWLRDTKLVVNGKSFAILIPNKKDMYYNEPNQTVHDKRWVVR